MSIMYVDFVKTNETEKVNVYLNNRLCTLRGEGYKTMSDYASIIHGIAKMNNAKIYLDKQGFGIGLLDELKKYNDIEIEPLIIDNSFVLR